MLTRFHVRPEDLASSLPPEWQENLLPYIHQYAKQAAGKIVMLDDDPGGTQAVPGTAISLLRDASAFEREFEADSLSFHVLMNSRSLPQKESSALHRHVARGLLTAQPDGNFTVISRGHVSLHSHFPVEAQTLMDALGGHFDGLLLMPAGMGGVTIEDIHYILRNGMYTPAGETEYAQDPAFGYSTSNLRAWVEEKTNGNIRAEDVYSISLDTIRLGGPQAVYRELMALEDRVVCVVNAASQQDADVVALAALMAQADGKRFMYRTGTAFAAAITGAVEQKALPRKQLAFGKGVGGLAIVGARTPSATKQLMTLLASNKVTGIEVRVESLLHDESQKAEIARCSDVLENALQQGDVVLYTSRRLVGVDDPTHARIVTQRVNAGLVSILNGITAQPRYIAVKGSITASEIAIRGLNVRRAIISGQLMPGVPVWTVGNGGTFLPKMSYFVIPGNVGDDDLLVKMVDMLH